jgi:hypothetical protein
MCLIIIKLFKTEYKEDLFMALSSAGIYKTTYCDAVNLDKELGASMSLFSGILKSAEEKERYAKVYFCFAEEKEQADAVIEGFEIAGIDWKKEEIFQMAVIPVEKLYP